MPDLEVTTLTRRRRLRTFRMASGSRSATAAKIWIVRIVDSEEFHTGQTDQRQMRDLTYTHCPHGSALAVLSGFLFRFTCCGIFGVAIASKAAKNCASLKGFDRVAATFLGADGRSV